MKSMISSYMLPLLLGVSVTACGGSPKPEAVATPAASTEVAPEPVEPPVAEELDETSWEGFFPLFQAAVATEDEIEVSYFVKIDEGIGSEEYLEQYSMFFNDDMKKTIAESTAASWTVSTSEEGVYQVAWSVNEVDEEGNETGTALILYFKKFDGKYRLFRWMAAG
tara:strand:- start:35242 stop:35739 length:498 start_codon:yes stop_codon:yes gene_type:complete